ncbi:MAG: hypothetical protein V4675_19365 [Verrucomicrobiota bacterium]
MSLSKIPFAVLGILLVPGISQSAPYASAVTVNGNDVSFVLNETADSVKVVFNEGATTMVIGTSPEPAGTKTFSKAGFTSFRIEVEKKAAPGWKSGVLQQLSNDTDDLVKFANGRGLAVNRKPDTGSFFGRVYVSIGLNGIAAPTTVPATTTRSTSEGIYVLNADLTVTSLGSGALSGSFASSSSGNSPYRVTVGDKGDLFITDWSDVNGSVYKTDGNVGGALNLLAGPVGSSFPVTSASGKIHGSIAAVAVSGSAATSDLKVWTIDEDLQEDRDSGTANQLNSIWEWNQGGDPLPLANPPARITSTGINFAAQTADLARGADGYLYKSQYRASGNESGIFIINPGGEPNPGPGLPPGTVSDSSRTAWQAFIGEPAAADPFLGSVACDISDDNWLAVMRLPDNAIQLIKIVEGKFDFSTYILLYPAPTTTQGRDISFDSAGNLYTLSSGQNLLRVYSRGGHTLAKTFSNGTFEITEPTPPLPSPPIDPYPMITGIAPNGANLEITFTSRLGRPDSHQLQRTADMELVPWEAMVNPGAPAPAIFGITGNPPNYTARVVDPFPQGERYFFRVKRN